MQFIKKRYNFMNNHYIYIYLDTRKPGNFIYDELIFDYEPFYVGQGTKYRWTSGLKNGGSFYKKNKINKIIKDGFYPKVIKIYENLNAEEASKIEIKLISIIGRNDLNKGPLVNLTDGGEGTTNISKDILEKRSEKIKGRKMSDKSKEKMRISKKEYFDAGNTTWNKGREWSKEERLKLTNKSNSGKKFSDEHKKKMSNNSKLQILNNKSIIKLRPIQQYSLNNELIKEYDSIVSASIETNIAKNAICNCCRNVSKTSGGFIWKYKK